MKKLIKKILSTIMKVIPMTDTIIFESGPDMACNTYPVYRYLLAKGLNKKYHFLWLVAHPENFASIHEENVAFAAIPDRSLISYLKHLARVSAAKVIIFSNYRIPKQHKKQYSIFLTHGTTTKRIKGIYDLGNTCDEFLYQSQFVKKIMAYEYSIDENRLISLGCPRNDALFQKIATIPQFISQNKENFVVWLPTYRQHKNNKIIDSKDVFPFAIPLIKTAEEMMQLNAHLTNLRLTLVIKSHPAQQIRKPISDYDHIVYITDDLLRINQTQLYELVGKSSGLITDYSSVYNDYLLLDRPIALTLADIDEYKQLRGFAIENQEELMVGVKVYMFSELLNFFDQLAKHEDHDLDQRQKMNRLFNDYLDNQSTQRVSEHILSEIKKRFG